MKKFTILIGAFMLSGIGLLFGQGATKVEITNFARNYSDDFQRKKEEAVRIALQKGWPVRVEYPDGRIIEIMEIGPNGMPEYDCTDNANAAETSGTDNLWLGGDLGLDLTGDIILLGEWDGGGVRTTHQEFRVGAGASRVTQRDVPAGLSSHSTHVAGTLIAEGQIAAAHGMATEASLDAYDWDNDIAEMGLAYTNDDLLLSNHSYGRIRGWDYYSGNYYWYGDITVSTVEDYQFGFYGPLAKTWDSLARLCPQYLIVKSAGNDRDDDWNGGHYVFSGGSWVWSTAARDPDGGADHYDCIENRAVAKNIITVGAVEEILGGYTQPSDVVMTYFSSWGPTDDGRIKPDLVADGDLLYSSISTGDSYYDNYGGTSMSSPVVTGSLALLQEYYHDLLGSYMYADQLKALVINTADEAGPADGPDYQFGWGLLNTDGAAELVHKHDSLGSIIRRSYLSNGETETFTYNSDGNTPLKVTICWMDPAHDTLPHALNPTTICLVHDLDLRVLTPSGGTSYPWRLNPSIPGNAATRSDNYRDNVETVYITSPPAGQYTVQVSHKGAISGQYYGLVVSGLQTQRFTNYWTGGGTTDYWYVNSNWSLGHDPVDVEDAVIPSGSSFRAIVDLADGICYSLNVGSDAWLEIRGDSLTIGQDLVMYGLLEMDNDAGRLIIGDDAYWFSGSSADIQAANTQIWVYGDWRFYSGTNVNITGGIVDFAGTGISYIYSYDTDASFNRLGIYKTGGGYVEHHSASTQPLRTNDLFYLHFNSEFRSTTSQSIIIKGYFSKTASATCNLINGTIVMDGTATNIFFDPPGYFNNLTISPSTSITLQDDIDVNGSLLIEQGTLIPNGHRINIAGNWRNTVGDAGFSEAGSRVIFDNPSGHSYVRSSENFDTLDVDIFAALRVDTASFTVTCDHYNWITGGVDVLAGTFTAEDLVQSAIHGYWYVNPTGTINLYQNTGEYIDLYGNLYILGGTMNIYGGGDNSWWGKATGTSVEITSGVLDFINNGVIVYNDFPFTENITGGTIRTPGRFNVYRADFNPTGGTLEFRSSTSGYISHNAGSNFYNILINKPSKGLLSTDEIPLAQKSRSNEPPPGKGDIVTLESNLDINGNLTIDNGILDVSASNYSINVAGNWTDNVDLTGFKERSGTVTFDGSAAKDLMTSETFYNLVLNKTYVGANALDIITGNIVYVNNNLNVNDGTLRINTNSILDITGDLTIAAGAALNMADVNTALRMEGDFTDNNASFSTVLGFYAGYYSTVLFYGTSDQLFSTAGTSMIFNNLTIDKVTSVFRTNENLELRGDLSVLTGTFQDNAANLVHSFRGDFTISPGANFYEMTGGLCKFIGSADQVITFDPVTTDGYFYNLTVDKSVAMQGEPGGKGDRANLVTMATDIISLVEGNLTVNYGTLDFNGNYFRALGDVKIYSGGKISIDDDAWLEVGGSDSLIVFSGGTLEVVGSAGHEAKVKNHSTYHAFEIRSGGTISAKHAIFEGTGSAGLYVMSGGLINATNDFDYCTFQNGQAGAAALLRIDNNQTITIDSAYFPASVTTKNVSKTLNQGSVTFVGATGTFAGPAYENDPNGRIHWAEYGKWDGSESSNWNTIGNWGFEILPTVSIDVIIPAGCPNYPMLTDYLGVNSSSYAYDCKSLNIEAGGKLTISGAYDIINFGIISTSGDLDIGDDYDGRNGSVLNIISDTSRFGNSTTSGLVYLNSGAEINFSGGELMTEGYTLNDGCQVHGVPGTAHLSVLGTTSSPQYIKIYDPDSYFSNFNVDAGASGSMLNSTYDLNTTNSFLVYGTFNNYGKTVTATYMDVYGTMNIDSGLVTVTDNGPYFHNSGILNMTGGTIDAGDAFYWYSGSAGTASGGAIYAEENWVFYDGCNVQLGTGNTVFFDQDYASLIKCQDSDASFGTVDLSKPVSTSSDTYIDAASTYPMLVAGNLYLRNGNQFHLQGEDLTVQGSLVNETGSEMDMITGADFINNLDYTLNGSLTNSGGNVLVHGTIAESATGILTISGGSFIADKAYSSSVMMNGTLNLSNGIFEVTHNPLQLTNTFVDNITGGVINVGATFTAADNVFQPSGGTVHLLDYSGGGSPYIQIGTVNWLQNLTVSSNIQWYISGAGATQLTILKDLTINSGGLIGSDDLVYIGDDWTNNVGTAGFVYGTGTVYLNGTVPTPERQVISGTTTFYNLTNNNIVAIVEFAGPTTINNIYNAGAGGAACETFITGTPVNVLNQLNLPQGAFALSTSAPVVTVASLTQGGTIQVTNGNFTANDLVEDHVAGSYTIYNGQINLNQNTGSYLDLMANLYIYGGEFNLIGGSDVSYWPGAGTPVLEMTNGILDFRNVGILMLNNDMSYNISGGKIKTSGPFSGQSDVSAFDPSGGNVDLYGNSNSNVNLGTGSYFYDLIISKSAAEVKATRSFTIKNELNVKQGTFNTNGFLINVGD
jgi:hypothetical protein